MAKAGIKLVGLKSAKSSGMGSTIKKAPTKFAKTGTTGGVKLVSTKRAAHMGTRKK